MNASSIASHLRKEHGSRAIDVAIIFYDQAVWTESRESVDSWNTVVCLLEEVGT